VSSACSYQIPLRVRSAPLTRPASGTCDPIKICAAAIDTSDFAERLAASARRYVPGDLLDIGAEGGQLGASAARLRLPLDTLTENIGGVSDALEK
jgi:hypothetical protein